MRSLGPALLLALLAACGGDDASTTTGSGGAGGDGGSGGTAGAGGSGGAGGEGGTGGTPNTINGCSATDTEACLYEPEALYELGTITDEPVSYVDEAGLTRTVQIELRRPMNAPTPLPIVMWSHGGSSGKNSAGDVGTGAGEAFVRAGYLFVAIAHTPRSQAEYAAICSALGLGGCTDTCMVDEDCTTLPEGICVDQGCRYDKHLGWDRPHDVAAIIDGLEAQSAAGQPLEGLIDPSTILYTGHSAGAGATMMLAGAPRTIGGVERLLADPRPTAFLSCSPQGPGEDGFTTSSFDGTGCAALASDPNDCFNRPHFFMTGIGDDTGGVVAEERRLAFDLAPAGDRTLLWNLDEAARHSTFNFEASDCSSYAANQGLDPALYPQRCDDYVTWQQSTAVAFADAHLRARPEAQAYLASDNLAVLYGELASVDRK